MAKKYRKNLAEYWTIVGIVAAILIICLFWWVPTKKETLTEFTPNDAITFNNRGIAYAEKGNYDDAIRDFTKAIELDSNRAKTMVTIGLMYKKKGDKENAKQWWKKALEKKAYLPDGGEKIVRQWLKNIED